MSEKFRAYRYADVLFTVVCFDRKGVFVQVLPGNAELRDRAVFGQPFGLVQDRSVLRVLPGGSGGIRYYVGGRYYNEKGLLKGSLSDKFRSYSIRGKLSAKVNKFIRFSTNISTAVF